MGIKKSRIVGILDLVHPTGLEPATPKFVAWYSIQLSYGCIYKFDFFRKINKTILSGNFLGKVLRTLLEILRGTSCCTGIGYIVRSPVFYPAKLQTRYTYYNGISKKSQLFLKINLFFFIKNTKS